VSFGWIAGEDEHETHEGGKDGHEHHEGKHIRIEASLLQENEAVRDEADHSQEV